MFHLLQPHVFVNSVLELTPERLKEMDVEALLLDVDCTLKRYTATEVPPEVAAWLKQLRVAGVRCCLVSNGREMRIRDFAEKLELPYVTKAMKPLTRGIKMAMQKIAAPPQRTAIAGDQIFADIMAGRLAGIRTILVEPIHPEEEPWFTRLKRRPEKWVLTWFGRRS
jgi:HAD superfamily phosphatase (TIGR01668 family)